MLELMLDIEQPDTDRRREPYQRGDAVRYGDIGRHSAQPGLPAAAHEADRQAVLYEEQIGRPHTEHDGRVPVDAVAKPTPSRQRQVFPYGERVDVAHAA